MSANNESVFKTLVVAIALCLVCSVLVSTAAVQLRPTQKANASLDKKRNILIAAGLYDANKSIEEQFANIEQKFVNLETGEFVQVDNPQNFDQRKMAKNPATSRKPKNDIARIGRQSKIVPVYLVKNGQRIETIILPIHGKGLFSTLYGFIALDSDKQTIKGLKFYEQGETPGLGGEVDNPRWLALWSGKKAIENGKPVLKLVKGGAKADNQVDALSGASMTTRGVQNMIDFWLGEEGYAPFLARLDVNGDA